VRKPVQIKFFIIDEYHKITYVKLVKIPIDEKIGKITVYPVNFTKKGKIIGNNNRKCQIHLNTISSYQFSREVINLVAGLILGPSIALGIIIGAYEAIVIHRDVSIPTHRFGHMAHAFILSIIFTLCTMNAAFVLSMIPQLAAIPILGTPHGLHILLGLIAAVKIHGTSLAIKGAGMGGGRGMGETWFHSILIGAIIAAAPYAYPLAEPMIPAFMKF